MILNINKSELENFLNYLADKVEPCYREEVEKAIKNFIADYDI